MSLYLKSESGAPKFNVNRTASQYEKPRKAFFVRKCDLVKKKNQNRTFTLVNDPSSEQRISPC